MDGIQLTILRRKTKEYMPPPCNTEREREINRARDLRKVGRNSDLSSNCFKLVSYREKFDDESRLIKKVEPNNKKSRS